MSRSQAAVHGGHAWVLFARSNFIGRTRSAFDGIELEWDCSKHDLDKRHRPTESDDDAIDSIEALLGHSMMRRR